MTDTTTRRTLLAASLALALSVAGSIYVGSQCPQDCSRWYCARDTRCMGAGR